MSAVVHLLGLLFLERAHRFRVTFGTACASHVLRIVLSGLVLVLVALSLSRHSSNGSLSPRALGLLMSGDLRSDRKKLILFQFTAVFS
jgi:hypothetical protein